MQKATTVATFGAVKQKEYTLIEQGEYVLTLLELEESAGQWGDRMVWKFMVAPKDDPTNYIARDDGNEKTVWVFTDRDIILGSFCQELVEVLSGRKFKEDGEPPSEDDLLGKRCVGYITHETPTRGKNAGIKREKIVEGSIKPFRLPPSKTTQNGSAKPSAAQVSADPSDEEIERATVVSKLQRQVARLVKLDERMGAEAQTALDASDLENADIVGIQALLDQVTEMVNKALDA
jgi:hypothetical protein